MQPGSSYRPSGASVYNASEDSAHMILKTVEPLAFQVFKCFLTVVKAVPVHVTVKKPLLKLFLVAEQLYNHSCVSVCVSVCLSVCLSHFFNKGISPQLIDNYSKNWIHS